jgi:hypothetical protein
MDDAHRIAGGVPPTEPPIAQRAHDDDDRSGDGWLELRIWAEMFNDAQQARIAARNRAERGGVDPDVYETYLATLDASEHLCRLALRRCARRVVPAPIRTWQAATVGLGDDLFARLLGHLGHPRWATPHHWEGTGANRHLVADPPYERTVGQLWAYCGHGDPTRRPRKGATADDLFACGNPILKMLVHLNAEACMKQTRSPYRLVYDDARATYADRVHAEPCIRCGPSGRPAAEGTPWSAAHQHAAALRKVGKEILRDLWIVGGMT